MRQFQKLTGVVIILIFTLGCSISSLLPNSKSETETETLDQAAFQAAEEQVGLALLAQEGAGGFFEEDTTGDGQLDQIMIRYPLEEVIPGVYARSNLLFNFDNLAPNPQQMTVEFANYTGQDQTVDYILVIPKYFAETVDQVAFSMDPVEIINPDIEAKFTIFTQANPDWTDQLQVAAFVGISIGKYAQSQARLKASAAADLEKICGQLKLQEDQNACWLSLVEDYSDVLTIEQKAMYCKNATGLYKLMCVSILNDNANECKYAETTEDQMACRAYYVLNKCDKLDGGEYQNCLKKTSISSKAPLGCLDIEDEDVRNECVALASKDPEFCKQIINEARKESCQKELGVKVNQPWEPLGGKGSDQEWFTGDQAKKDCEYFHGSFSAYTVDYVLGQNFQGINKLSCSFVAKYSDGTSSSVNIWIEGYPTTQEARVIWDEQNGANSDWLKTMNERAVNESDRTVFSYNEDWYFSSYLLFTEPKHYVNDGKAIYQNTIIWFIEDGMSSASNATWLYVKQSAEFLVDQKNRR